LVFPFHHAEAAGQQDATASLVVPEDFRMKRFVLVLACLSLGGAGVYLGQTVLQGQAPVTRSGTAVLLPKELTSYRDVVKKVLPAVVSIEAQSRSGRARPNRPGDMQLPGAGDPFKDNWAIDDETPSRIGFGSGFIVSPKGVVVTNNHVVEGADQVLVHLRDGSKYTSTSIKTDAKSDLAIIRLDAKLPLSYLEFGDSNDMEIGDRVLAVGAPFGLTGTVTHGIISSKGRSLRMNMYEDFLQTDAAINPGNSGGPLVNLEGKVIGVNSAIKSRTGGFQGIGMAISSNMAKWIANQLLENGVVRRGYLGVGIQDVDDDIAKDLGLKEAKGVKVTRIYRGAPGAKAGLKTDDVILELGGKRVANGQALQLAVAALPLGKPVDLRIVRDGKPQTLKVTIEEQPEGFGAARAPRIPEIGRGSFNVERVGIVVTDLTEELADALGYDETVKGGVIVRMERAGLAALAGLQTGMVIVKVNKKATTTAKAVKEVMAAGSTAKGITVQVRSQRGGLRTFVLREEE
jgi:serine protease Do